MSQKVISKKVQTLVEIESLNPDFGIKRYASHTNDVKTLKSLNPYISMPKLDVPEIPNNILGLPSHECLVTLTRDFDDFTQYISAGEIWAPMNVRVIERTEAVDGTEQLIYPFWGEVYSTINNFDKKPNTVTLKAYDQKSEIFNDRPMNLILEDQCQWAYGSGRGCKASLLTNTQTGEITNISGLDVTIDVSSINVVKWSGAFLSYKGTSIDVKNGTGIGPPVVLTMRRPVPASWLNKIVSATFGCDHYLSTCILHGQEQNNGAIGWAIPIFNPLLEIPFNGQDLPKGNPFTAGRLTC